MPRHALNHEPLARRLRAASTKLIDLGGLLVLMPLLWIRSPYGFATRAFAPFGWLALMIGFALLTFEMRRQAAAASIGDGRSS